MGKQPGGSRATGTCRRGGAARRRWFALGILLIACGSRSQLRDELSSEGTSGDGGKGGNVGITNVTGSVTTVSGSSASVGTGSSTGGSGGSDSGGVAGAGALGGAGGIPGRLDGPFYREYRERKAPPFEETNTSPPAPTGRIYRAVLHRNDPLRYVTPALFGNNAAVWNGDSLLSDLMQKRLSDVNVSVLRFPGGSTSDQYHFDGVYPDYAVANGWNVMSEDWAASTAEYMNVVRGVGAIPLITVNHGFASYGSVEEAATLAAAWVEYCNSPNDGRNPGGGIDWAARRAADGYNEPFAVQYWEIGNEAYGDWETGYDPTGEAYAKNFVAMAAAMKAVDPTIYIGLIAPADAANERWTSTVLSYPGIDTWADFLSVHDYFEYVTRLDQLTPQYTFSLTNQVRDYKERLEQLLISAGFSVDRFPFYLGEYNLGVPTHSYQIAHISSLFIADVLGQLLHWGWAGASLWDVQNEYDAGSGFGAGDHGFLAFADPSVPDLTPRPSYFPFYFFTRNFGDVLLSSTGPADGVVVYASAWNEGVLGVVAINESADPRTLQLEVRPNQRYDHANVWLLSADDVEGPITLLNGIGNGLPAGGPDPTTVPPYTVRFDGSPELALPPYSLLSVLLYR